MGSLLRQSLAIVRNLVTESKKAFYSISVIVVYPDGSGYVVLE